MAVRTWIAAAAMSRHDTCHALLILVSNSRKKQMSCSELHLRLLVLSVVLATLTLCVVTSLEQMVPPKGKTGVLSVRWSFSKLDAELYLPQLSQSVRVCMHASDLTKAAMQPRHYAAPPRQRRQSMESARMVRLLRKVSMYGGVDITGAPLQVGWQVCVPFAVLQNTCHIPSIKCICL